MGVSDYKRRMRRRIVWAIVAAVAAAGIAGWVFTWYHFAGNIRERVGLWAAARRTEGVTVNYGAIGIDGFPLRWHVSITQPHLEGAGPTGWTWDGAAVEADLKPWRISEIPLRFPGRQTFAAGRGDVAERWTVVAGRPEGQAGLDERGRLDRLNLDLGDVTLTRASSPESAHADYVTAHAQLFRAKDGQTAADHQTDTFDLALGLDNVQLPRPVAALLGTQIAHADIDLSFKGRLPNGNLPSSVSVWRDDGGTVDINRVAVKWGPIDADGNGTLALDEQNRLLGAFTARWRGYNETIDTLVNLGQIRPMQAAGAKIALRALSRQNGSGVDEVQIPLTAQDGKLFVAGFPLIAIPALNFE